MDELKPCPITTEEAANAADVLMQIAPQNLQQVNALSAANKVLLWVALLRQEAPGNKPISDDDCTTCQFLQRDVDQNPCKLCRNTYTSKYARKPEQEEHT